MCWPAVLVSFCVSFKKECINNWRKQVFSICRWASNLLQKDPPPSYWWCHDGVRPTPSDGMFTWQACWCLCRNNCSFEPMAGSSILLLQSVWEQREAAWGTGGCNYHLLVWCQCQNHPARVWFCLSRSAKYKVLFSFLNVLFLLDEVGEEELVCFLPWPTLVSDSCDTSCCDLSHTPAASSSSQSGAKVLFLFPFFPSPVCFQAVFLTWTGHFLTWGGNSFSRL